MLDSNAVYRCDAVMQRKPGAPEHVCQRRAIVASERNVGTVGMLTLHYCRKHERRANKSEGIVTVRRVYSVTNTAA